MPIILPYVPRTITVHLGLPDQWAENVTVNFPDYVKNVASSEIYPTWEPAAIRANVLAIISFALCDVWAEQPGYAMLQVAGVQIFPDVETLQAMELIPLPQGLCSLQQRDERDIPAQNL